MVYLRQLSEALGLPITGSSKELRQQIEGKLSEREDSNVQVVIQETPQVEAVLWLVDTDGPFLQTTSIHRECRGSSDSELTGELAATRQQLDEALAGMRQLQLELEAVRRDGELGSGTEVDRLKAKLEAERERHRQLWRTSCEQVAEQDALLSDKEAELEVLRTRLATLTAGVPALTSAREGASSEEVRSLKDAFSFREFAWKR